MTSSHIALHFVHKPIVMHAQDSYHFRLSIFKVQLEFRIQTSLWETRNPNSLKRPQVKRYWLVYVAAMFTVSDPRVLGIDILGIVTSLLLGFRTAGVPQWFDSGSIWPQRCTLVFDSVWRKYWTKYRVRQMRTRNISNPFVSGRKRIRFLGSWNLKRSWRSFSGGLCKMNR